MNKPAGGGVSAAMKTSLRPLAVLAVASLSWLGSSAVAARPECGHGPRRELPAVIVYGQPNFRGPALVLYPGDQIDNLAHLAFPDGSRINDRVVSVEVVGRASVLFYEHSRFRGHVLRITDSVRHLGNHFLPDSPQRWSGVISSLRVEAEPCGRPTPPITVARAQAQVTALYQALLERDPDVQGLRHYTMLLTTQGWTPSMVEEAIRGSAEFRDAHAARIVTQAYREVLRRDPDPEGLANYKRLVLQRGWGLDQLRRTLRSSEEFRLLAWHRS